MLQVILEHLIPSGDDNHESDHDAPPWRSQVHSFCPSSFFYHGIRHHKTLVPCKIYEEDVKERRKNGRIHNSNICI